MKIQLVKKDFIDGLIYSLVTSSGPILFFATWSLAKWTNKFTPEILLLFGFMIFLFFAVYLINVLTGSKLKSIRLFMLQIRDQKEITKISIMLIALLVLFYLYEKDIILDYIFAFIFYIFVIIAIYFLFQSRKKFEEKLK